VRTALGDHGCVHENAALCLRHNDFRPGKGRERG